MAIISGRSVGQLGNSGYSGISGYSGYSGLSGEAQEGAVIGPDTSIENAIAKFGDNTGELLISSGVLIDDFDDIIIPDGSWIGLGTSSGRIEFVDDTIDRFNILDCNIGIGEEDPETIIEISHINPYIQLNNTELEDIDYGRESRVIAKGHQSGGEQSTLGYMEFAHDGISNDQKGIWTLALNDGSDGDAPTTVMTVLANGNVGIGTTEPAIALDVQQGTYPQIGVSDGDNDWLSFFSGNLAPAIFWSDNRDLRFGTTPSSGALYNLDFTESMRITKDSNVGIGTVSPDGRLHIVTPLSAGSEQIALILGNPDFTAGMLTDLVWQIDTDSESKRDNAAIKVEQADVDSTIMSFWIDEVGLQQRMTITNFGNVGIGVTDPDARLEVLYAGIQQKLSYDNANYITLATQSDGDLTIDSNKASYVLDLGDGIITTTGFLDGSGLIIGTTSGGTITDIKDEDDMASNSQVSLATQQSIKAYVDTGNTAIYTQLSDSTDQTFGATGTAQSITFDTNDEISGLTHSVASDTENIIIITSGVYSIIAQPQVTAGPGDAGYFHMWLQKDTGGGFADVANSNVELTLDSNDEDVIPLIITISLDAGDIIRLRASVGDTGILLDAQTPASEPAIPSIIFSMFCVGT